MWARVGPSSIAASILCRLILFDFAMSRSRHEHHLADIVAVSIGGVGRCGCVDLQPRKYDLNVTPDEVVSGGERNANA